MPAIRTSNKSGRKTHRTFRQAFGHVPGRVGQFSIEPTIRPDVLPREALDHFWHPDRTGVEPAPDAFAQLVSDISSDLRVVRPPPAAPLDSRAWLVWYRCLRVTHPLSPGWLMLFEWRFAGRPLPLDNRLLANIYKRSARVFGSARKYFDHCMAELARDKAGRESTHRDEVHTLNAEMFASRQIKNIGRGNKFAKHHDGTVIPSQGERNWTREQRKLWLPSDLRKREELEHAKSRAYREGVSV